MYLYTNYKQVDAVIVLKFKRLLTVFSNVQCQAITATPMHEYTRFTPSARVNSIILVDNTVLYDSILASAKYLLRLWAVIDPLGHCKNHRL